MASVPVTISGVLYDKRDRTSRPVTLIGEASQTGLGVGGGPVYPEGQPPGIWGGGNEPFPTPPIFLPDRPGGRPEHPIVLPPNVPAHPIVIPDEPPKLEIWPPLVNNDLPDPEPQPPDPNPCFRLVYSLRYGWALVPQVKRK